MAAWRRLLPWLVLALAACPRPREPSGARVLPKVKPTAAPADAGPPPGALRQAAITFPGTGISLVALDGMRLAPASSLLLSDDGEIIVMLATSEKHIDLEQDDVWMGVFRHKDASFSIQDASATLYSVTRAREGDVKYDSWWLCVHAPEALVSVQAFYTGANPAVFAQLESVVRSLHWTTLTVDAERALGYRVTHPGVELVTHSSGPIKYALDPQYTGGPATRSAQISLSVMPVAGAKADKILEGCETVLRGKVQRGPTRRLEFDGYRGCQVVSAVFPEQEPDYRALLLSPEGAFLLFTGSAKPAVTELLEGTFDQAVRSLTRVRP
jgi:hypothetical protein